MQSRMVYYDPNDNKLFIFSENLNTRFSHTLETIRTTGRDRMTDSEKQKTFRHQNCRMLAANTIEASDKLTKPIKNIPRKAKNRTN